MQLKTITFLRAIPGSDAIAKVANAPVSVYVPDGNFTTLATGILNSSGAAQNPLTTNANGQVLIAAPDGPYDLRCTASDGAAIDKREIWADIAEQSAAAVAAAGTVTTLAAQVESDAETATTQAGIATTQAGIATAQANVALAAVAFTTNRPDVRLAATGPLPANTYDNGAGTITITATGVLTVDGVAVALNDDIVVPAEADQTHNGIYRCTTAGAVGVSAVLTRRPTEDTGAELAGACVKVLAGTANTAARYRVDQSSITLGTTAVTFSQQTGPVAIALAAEAALREAGDTTNANAISGLMVSAPYRTFYGPSQRPVQVLVGSTVVTAISSGGVFESNHSHAQFAQIAALEAKAQFRTFFGPSKRLMQFVANSVVLAAIGPDGAFESASLPDRTAQFARYDASATKTEALENWIVWTTVVGTKEQVMVFDGSVSRQLTDSGYRWLYPTVSLGNVVRCLSDYTTGTLEPHSILPSGEIYPERSVLAQTLRIGQSLALDSRGGTTDPVTGNYSISAVPNPDPSSYGEFALMFSGFNSPRIYDGSTETITPTSAMTDFQVLHEGWDGTVLGGGSASTEANISLKYAEVNGNFRRRRLFTASGKGGTAYAGLKKGNPSYASAINSVTSAHGIAAAKGWRHIVESVDCVHGEAQVSTLAAIYAGYLEEWRTDYQTDIQTIISYNPAIPFFLSQMNTHTGDISTDNLREIADGQLLAHDTYPLQILYAPKYQHPYFDFSHMTGAGYERDAVHRDKAKRHYHAGRKWQPLRITSAVLSGLELTLTYNNTVAGYNDITAGPIGPLAFDVSVKSDPGNYGFEFADAAAVVASIALGGAGSTVVITFTTAPSVGTEVYYAMQTVTTTPAPQTGNGPRGNVRDGDTRDIYPDGAVAYNYALAQRITITA